MSRPTAISPEEQEQIARQIGVLLLQAVPDDWQQITVEYRATGEHHDLLGEIIKQDGTAEQWEPPSELPGIFENLRDGMYRPDVGTWLSALYIVERPSSYRIDINFDSEPSWHQPLPRGAYADELRRYPRAEENIPEWMWAKLDGSDPSAEEDPADEDPAAERSAGVEFTPTAPQPGDAAGTEVADTEAAGTGAFEGGTGTDDQFAVPASPAGLGEPAATLSAPEPPQDSAVPDSAVPAGGASAAGSSAAPDQYLTGRAGGGLASEEPPAPAADVPGTEQAPAVAEVFVDIDDQGLPLLTGRPPVPLEEVAALRQYLETAPLVQRTSEHHDELDPERSPSVPGTWHTDGAWLWPGAVPYYLAQYGVPPQPELLAHISERGFAVPAVPQERLAAIRGFLEGTADPADEAAAAEVPAGHTGETMHTGDTGETGLIGEPATFAPEEDWTTSDLDEDRTGTAPEADVHAEQGPAMAASAAPEQEPSVRGDESTQAQDPAGVPELGSELSSNLGAGLGPGLGADRPEAGGGPEDADNPEDADSPEGVGDLDAPAELGPSEDLGTSEELGAPEELLDGPAAGSAYEGTAFDGAAFEENAFDGAAGDETDAAEEPEEPDISPESVFAQLHDKLSAHGVGAAEYRIGSRVDTAHCLLADGASWVVTDEDAEVRFARVDHAAAFLLGTLLLRHEEPQAGAAPADAGDPARRQAADVPSSPEAASAPVEPLDAPQPGTAAPEAAEPEAADSRAGAGLPKHPGGNPLFTANQPSEPPEPAGDIAQALDAEAPAQAPLPDARPTPPEAPAGQQPQPPASQPPAAGQAPGMQPPAPQAPSAHGGQPPAQAPAPQPPQGGQQPPQAPVGPPANNGAPVPPLPKRQPRQDGGMPPAPQQPNAPQPNGAQLNGAHPNGAQPNGTPGTGAPPQGQASMPPRPQQPGAHSGGQPPAPAPGQPMNPSSGGQPVQTPAAQANIQPLSGEPPLTLYRDRQQVMLQPGTELDRFGEPGGNVTYAFRTPYGNRSLPPQWANRNYYAYRVQRPLQVLRGSAVPWFEQPGGGTAYVLPTSVEELLAEGVLVEMPPTEALRPPME